MKKNIVLIVCMTVVIVYTNKLTAQEQNINPIWGASPLQSGIENPANTLTDEEWGVLPSEQGRNVDLWGRPTAALPTTAMIDIHGNPVLTDNNGNILYDNNGNPIVDSVALNGGLSTVESSSMTIPDDPVDVPLDGGTGLLIALASAMGYKKKPLLVKVLRTKNK